MIKNRNKGGNSQNTKKITQLYHLKGYNTLNKIYLSYRGDTFIFKKNISSNVTNNISEEDSDDDHDNDKLFLNGDSDDDEENENVELKKKNSDKNSCDNKSTSTCLNNEIETKNIPTQIKKKSKYDSDKIIIYEDITELPSDICSSLLANEEIEQINTGVPDYDFGIYVNNIIHNKNKNK
ncbi:conserved Plasmodium protein, unknown function [Plasmodium relictum]|uniref:Uncharacterized protein n=1 Tax=Plasmodium relictum TaxID=85471 RepID=A0A1J1HIF7_PLARL|nr:conserved Plasmodium protein, unknown function [Plasmodium relictum]CRH04045.1 conserved Plasmodium protein, unknown function [Plasmodium relictum]